MTPKFCAPAAVMLVVGLTASASAMPVSCPGTMSTTDREFILDTAVASTCYQFGTGNINGNNDPINQLGWTTLDKSDDTTSGSLPGVLTITGQGTTSGSFSIDPLAWSSFSSIAIGFKSGEGQLDPDWAVFLLAPGTLSGTWSLSGSQSLSHANLYGEDAVVTPPTSVPEPASVLLCGLGLLVMAGQLRGRRRHNADLHASGKT